MATITLKDVPAELHRRLKEGAERNRRSMNSEALVCLEQVLLPHTRRSAAEAIAEAEALNQRTGRVFSSMLIEEGKREGQA